VELELEYLSTYPHSIKAVTQLAWKPTSKAGGGPIEMEVAIASEDSSLRIYSLAVPIPPQF